MIAAAWWQDLLGALGWVLAKLYQFIPNYGVAIILLTVAIRLVLLPLGIKQIRSMQAMAAIQPKMKAIQQKYKGNRAKQQEEMQKLYQEHGVNPLAGCLPMLLQLPVLIALYAILRFPTNVGAIVEAQPHPWPNSHIPPVSSLYDDIVHQQGGIHFVGTNLLCSAAQAGTQVTLEDSHHNPYVNQFETLPNGKHPAFPPLDCGHGVPVRIPYYVFALLMVGTTYYQQRQMQKANPVGSQQTQALTRVMPLLFGVWGFIFPAGLVVYWTTSNVWQIGQQHFMLRAKQKADAARASGDGKMVPARPRKKTWFASFMERANQAQTQRSRARGDASRPRPRADSPGGGSGIKPGPPATGESPKAPPPRSPGSSGGKNAVSRKKRRKR
jgi:YidC/Oxa1 family membrane protein insertase